MKTIDEIIKQEAEKAAKVELMGLSQKFRNIIPEHLKYTTISITFKGQNYQIILKNLFESDNPAVYEPLLEDSKEKHFKSIIDNWFGKATETLVEQIKSQYGIRF